MRIWSRPGSRAAGAAFQRLQRIAREIEQDAEQLVVIGLDDEPALDRADPADRRVGAETERLVHLLDQRLEQNLPAVRRRLLHAAVGQRRLAEGDGAFERVHQFRRETLHARIGNFGEPVGEQLRRGQQIAQIVIDLGHREPERREPALLMQHRGELDLHGGKLALGGADLVGARRTAQ